MTTDGEIRVQFQARYNEDSAQARVAREVDEPNILSGESRAVLSEAFRTLTEPLLVVDDEANRTVTIRVRAIASEARADAIEHVRDGLSQQCGIAPADVVVSGW